MTVVGVEYRLDMLEDAIREHYIHHEGNDLKMTNMTVSTILDVMHEHERRYHK